MYAYEDSDDKLKHAQALFEDAVDHTAEAHREAHRAERYYHNTDGEGQWEAEDLRYLRDQMRPAYTFNIIKGKVDSFLGMYSDAQRVPRISAAGSDDTAAQVLDAIKEGVLEEAEYEDESARQMKTGTIAGECGLHLEVAPNHDGPDWVEFNIHRIMPYELHWDIASINPSRKDARYVFWDRWLDKQEFINSYPEHKDHWKTVTSHEEPYDGIVDSHDAWAEPGGTQPWESNSDYNDERWNRYYYDRQKNKMRVIRYEYKTFRKIKYLRDEEGEKIEIDDRMWERAQQANEMGADFQLIEETKEVVEVCEFAGKVMLAEYDSAGPFDGFSIVPYCYDVDEETGTTYGLVRNLFDPQQELNKGKSLEIEYLAQATAPGTTAEEGAIPDIEQYSDESRTPGGVAIVARDALTAGKVQERQPPAPSAAVMERMRTAMELINEVSTIPTNTSMTAAEHSQSGVSLSLRYHKSRQSVSNPFAHFEKAQRTFVRKVSQAIIRAMPDSQITAILGPNSRYVVQDGLVHEVMQTPQGPQPKNTVELRNIRNTKWMLDMEYTSENSTLRMLELDILLQLVAAGVPIDPEVLVDRATNSRSVAEQLKAYIEKAQQAQSEGMNAQNQAMMQQNAIHEKIEGSKIAETQRHNMAQEQLKLQEQKIRERLGHLEIWERADDKEKDRMVEMAVQKMQLDNQRSMEAQPNGY